MQLQQCHRFDLPLILIFICFIAAFNSVERDMIWRILEGDGMSSNFLDLSKAYYEGMRVRLRAYGEESENFAVHSGVKQDYVLSPSFSIT
jgi:hypothetical protein